MKKLAELRIPKNCAKGVSTTLSLDPGDEIAEGYFWTDNPSQLRKLAVWCTKAAKLLEEKPRRGR